MLCLQILHPNNLYKYSNLIPYIHVPRDLSLVITTYAQKQRTDTCKECADMHVYVYVIYVECQDTYTYILTQLCTKRRDTKKKAYIRVRCISSPGWL